MVLLCASFTLTVNAQQSQSQQKVENLKKAYMNFKNPEISLDRFLKIHEKETLESAAAFTGCSYLDNPCDGGSFETPLDPSEFQGAYGYWYSGGDPDPNALTDGLLSGDLFDDNAHQTIVTKASDYFTGISTVPPDGGAQALRLGNAINGYGAEILSKTFKVVNGNFKFSYAVVFQDPGHPYYQQPAFTVRVYDCASGQEITNVCNLGDGSNKIVSDAANPFFQSLNDASYGLIAYRDWTNSFIDLKNYIGRTVNVQFVNQDCGQGGHFGYTYLDNICGSDTVIIGIGGGAVLNATQTDSCGKGTICADYILGKNFDSSVTGTAVLHLNIYQNGSIIKTVDSDTLTVDSSTYCFSIDPSALGVDTSLGGFDYTITNDFFLQGYDYVNQPIGDVPYGVTAGLNNDYSTAPCGSGGGSDSCKNVCITDNFGYKWRICYTKRDNFNEGDGTVDLGGGVIWKAHGWLNCKDGLFGLHAINPNADNCASGYTDSFVYRGISFEKCNMAAIHVGNGNWRSFCSGGVVNRGTFSAVNCGSQADKVINPDNITPAKSGKANDIVLKVSPNPVQNVATINYTVAKDSKVNIVVYNYMMQPIKTLVSGSKAAGNYSVVWNVNQSGNVGSGLYKVVAIVNGKSYTTTVQVTK